MINTLINTKVNTIIKTVQLGSLLNLEPEVITYLNGLTTPVSNSYRTAINNFVKGLKTGLSINSLSETFDTMYLLSGETEEVSLKNLVKNAHHAQKTGSALFYKYEGFQGDGSSYINTNYNAGSTDAVNYKLNDCSYGLYSRTDINGDNYADLGSQDNSGASYAIIRSSANFNFCRLNVAGGSRLNISQASSLGMFIATRNGSAAANNYGYWNKTSSSENATAVSTAIPNLNNYILANNLNGTANKISIRLLSFAFWGKYITTAMRDVIVDSFNLFLSEIGALALMPIGKQQHSSDVLDGIIYVAGGDTLSPKTMYAYNPATDVWTTKAALPFAGAKRQSASLNAYNGKLYFIGGYNEEIPEYYGDVYEYDPIANTWATKTPMPTLREDFGTAILNGKIYCFGGTHTSKGVVKNLEIYDIASDTWDTTKADMPDYKALGDFGVACNGKIYAIGGTNSMETYMTSVIFNKKVFEYTPETDTWAIKSDIPEGTGYKECVAIGNKIYSLGGRLSTGANPSDSDNIYVYNTETDTWTLSNTKLPYRMRGTAACVYDNKIYLSGGAVSGFPIMKNIWKLTV